MMAAKDDYEEFRNMLNDLKMNSKPLINTLTILAEKKIHHAQLIVRAIEERILEVCVTKNRNNNFWFRFSMFRQKLSTFFRRYMFSIRLLKIFVQRFTFIYSKRNYPFYFPLRFIKSTKTLVQLCSNFEKLGRHSSQIYVCTISTREHMISILHGQ